MNPRLLNYYNRELQHLREMGGEFARDFPKIAGRLGLDGFECADPYVERLVESFAFLAARVQLKIDAEFPRLTEHLLELVYPHCLAPTPSMLIARFVPNLANPALAEGAPVARGTALRSSSGLGQGAPCEYRTAHALTLWPLEIAEAAFFTFGGQLAGMNIPVPAGTRGGLRLRLRVAPNVKFAELPLDRLSLHLCGPDSLPFDIHARLISRIKGIVVVPADAAATWHHALPASALRASGFDEDQALLPYGHRSFQGYRLLHEYFAFAHRYLFVDVSGLQPAIARCAEKVRELDIFLLLDEADTALEQVVSASNFALHCTPAINLFPRRAERIHLSREKAEYHVVADRTRPLDFEVHSISRVQGYGTAAMPEMEFRPFYQASDLDAASGANQAYFQLRRAPQQLSDRQRRQGPRSSYIGSETWIALVDAREAPWRSDLRQLGLDLWCTNRDLPLQISIGVGNTDFTSESGAPIDAIRCLAGPSRPLPSNAQGNVAWRLVSHLSLSYLTLLDGDAEQGPKALRELLRLYAPAEDVDLNRQIDGLRAVATRPITRRIPGGGPIIFGRGLEITLTLVDDAFVGSSMVLFGAVLDQFFSRYTSINSFIETVVRSERRGELMRWPARVGRCHVA